MVFYFDFSEHEGVNFDTFLPLFEHMIIDQLVRNFDKIFPKGEKQAFETLEKVAFKFYDKQLFEAEIAKSINRVLTRKGQTFGYSLNVTPTSANSPK